MAKTKRTFVAEDGEEFETETEADEHSSKVAAKDELDAAKARFIRSMVQYEKTADGHELGTSWRLYFVTPGLVGPPAIREVRLSILNAELDGSDRLVFDVADNERKPFETTRYRLEDLYTFESNAKAAWAERSREWLAEKEAEIDRIAGD